MVRIHFSGSMVHCVCGPASEGGLPPYIVCDFRTETSLEVWKGWQTIGSDGAPGAACKALRCGSGVSQSDRSKGDESTMLSIFSSINAVILLASASHQDK